MKYTVSNLNEIQDSLHGADEDADEVCTSLLLEFSTLAIEYRALFTMYAALFTKCRALSTIYRALFTIHRALFTICRALLRERRRAQMRYVPFF